MLKKQHSDKDIQEAKLIVRDKQTSIEEKLMAVLHVCELACKVGFDVRQNTVAIMNSLNIPMVADRQQDRKDNEA